MLLLILQILLICLTLLTWICIGICEGISLCHYRTRPAFYRKSLLLLSALWIMSSYMVYIALLCHEMSSLTYSILIAVNILLTTYGARLVYHYFYPRAVLTFQQNNQKIVAKKSRTFIPTAEQKKRIYDYLNSPELFQKKVTLTRMSKSVIIDRTDLSRFIKQEFGISLSDLITSLRLNHAERMLAAPEEKHLTITEISEICGFQALSSFYKAFRERHNLSPLEWREQYAKKNQPRDCF